MIANKNLLEWLKKIDNKLIGEGFVEENKKEVKKLNYEEKKERKADF